MFYFRTNIAQRHMLSAVLVTVEVLSAMQFLIQCISSLNKYDDGEYTGSCMHIDTAL